jgi:hypothetical protein
MLSKIYRFWFYLIQFVLGFIGFFKKQKKKPMTKFMFQSNGIIVFIFFLLLFSFENHI